MTTFLKASCHCGLNAFNLALSLPISGILCHCNICRHTTGQLVNSFARIVGVPLAPSSTSQPADLSTLTPYKSSNIATRWFCGRCSAHMFWEGNDNYESPGPSWFVMTGTLEPTKGTLNVSYTSHIWVGDTLDGGIADHLPTIDGVKLLRYATKSSLVDVLPTGWNNLPSDTAEDHTRLHFHCHCKSNTFSITRPTHASSLPSSPYPDLTHAYISHPHDVLFNPADEKWWLRPVGSPNSNFEHTHYLAGHCACTSCRTTSGSPIQSWAFVPRTNIFFKFSPGPSPSITSSGEHHNIDIELDLRDPAHRPPGLKRYISSKGRNREFCGTCGATVFWWGEERPELVDVSVGLVDESQGGARAEAWFEWWRDRVSFEEDAVERRLVGALEEGLGVVKR